MSKQTHKINQPPSLISTAVENTENTWRLAQARSHFATLIPQFNLVFLDEVDSTNTHLMRCLRDGMTQPTILLAERQTAAKARRGKQWETRPKSSLMFSIATPIPSLKTSHKNIGWLALISACTVVNVLLKHMRIDQRREVKIKWPNDIWCKPDHAPGWHKLAGILIETVTVAQQQYAVVGLGLNVISFETHESLEIPPGSLNDLALDWDGATAFFNIAPEIAQAVYNFKDYGIAERIKWQNNFACHDLLQGQLIRTVSGIEGIGAGINEDGLLILKTARGLQAIHDSEVMLKACLNI